MTGLVGKSTRGVHPEGKVLSKLGDVFQGLAQMVSVRQLYHCGRVSFLSFLFEFLFLIKEDPKSVQSDH